MEQVAIVRRKPSFLYSSLKIAGIEDILSIVAKEPRSKPELIRLSKILMKNSILKYIEYCEKKGLISSHVVSQNTSNSNKTRTKKTWKNESYSITDKGKSFLEMFA